MTMNIRRKAQDIRGEHFLPLSRVLEFMRLLWEVFHGMHSTSKRMEDQIGVTGSQRLVIRIIGQHNGLSAGELASTMCVHPSTLTGVLRRLQKNGTIQRKTDREDHRRTHFFLSAKGRRLNRIQSNTVESAVRKALMGISEDHLTNTKNTLRLLATQLALSNPHYPRRGRHK